MDAQYTETMWQLSRNLAYPAVAAGLLSAIVLRRPMAMGIRYGMGFGIGYSLREFKGLYDGMIN